MSGPPTPPLLAAQGVRVDIAGRRILADVSLHVHVGELVGVMGANGAGKSTLLDVLAGRRVPGAGVVQLLGDDVTRLGPRLRAQRGLCLVPQGGRVLEHLSVAEHLRLGALAAGHDEGDATSELVTLLTQELDPQTPVADLAHAARLDLELATVIATQPHVILLDEPSAGLDQDERRRTARHLRTIHAAIPRLGMLVVEHDEEFLRGIVDRTLLVVDGRITATATL